MTDVHPRPSRAGHHRLRSAFMALAVAALTVWAATTAPGSARAAELVMFEAPGCTWCAQWHEEIGPIYPKTDESHRAPLRRVNLHDPWPKGLKDLRSVTFTPTFVLVHDGQEVDRITGYAGDDFFWFQLNELMKKLPADAAAPTDPAAPED